MRRIFGLVALVTLISTILTSSAAAASQSFAQEARSAPIHKTYLPYVVTYTDVVPGPVSRAYAVRLINEERARVGMPSVVEDARLDQSAQVKADDMAVRDYFGHVTPDGHPFWWLLDQAGVPYTWAGENLAAINPVDRSLIFVGILPRLQNALVNSAGHRAVMDAPNAKRVGVGLHYRDVDDKVFYVQHFSD